MYHSIWFTRYHHHSSTSSFPSSSVNSLITKLLQSSSRYSSAGSSSARRASNCLWCEICASTHFFEHTCLYFAWYVFIFHSFSFACTCFGSFVLVYSYLRTSAICLHSSAHICACLFSAAGMCLFLCIFIHPHLFLPIHWFINVCHLFAFVFTHSCPSVFTRWYVFIFVHFHSLSFILIYTLICYHQ